MTITTLELTDSGTALISRLLEAGLKNGSLLNGPEIPDARAILAELGKNAGAARGLDANSQPNLLDPAPEALFTEDELISRYTREQAIADGVLVDVTEVAKEAGFICPVAVTATLMADIKDIPVSKKGIQDKAGRLWDVVYIGLIAAKILQDQNEERYKKREPFLTDYVYQITLPVGRKKKYYVKLSLGRGDRDEPVATLMKPDED